MNGTRNGVFVYFRRAPTLTDNRGRGEQSVSCVMVHVALSVERSPSRSVPAFAARSDQPRTVLVVEDEWLLLELAAEVLEAAGHKVLTATDAHAALSLLRSEPIDLLVTDIDLAAGTDGLSLAREARRLRPELRVAYASGRRPDLCAHDMVPGSIFLAKPYRPAQIAQLPQSLSSP